MKWNKPYDKLSMKIKTMEKGGPFLRDTERLAKQIFCRIIMEKLRKHRL